MNTHAPDTGWIGVDLDGTLAEYHGWVRADHIGDPIEPMCARVRTWLAEGRQVRIFTARVYPITVVIDEQYTMPSLQFGASDRMSQAVMAAVAIRNWSRIHFGRWLPITCVKDFAMTRLYDDRAFQVVANKGLVVGGDAQS